MASSAGSRSTKSSSPKESGSLLGGAPFTGVVVLSACGLGAAGDVRAVNLVETRSEARRCDTAE